MKQGILQVVLLDEPSETQVYDFIEYIHDHHEMKVWPSLFVKDSLLYRVFFFLLRASTYFSYAYHVMMKGMMYGIDVRRIDRTTLGSGFEARFGRYVNEDREQIPFHFEYTDWAYIQVFIERSSGRVVPELFRYGGVYRDVGTQYDDHIYLSDKDTTETFVRKVENYLHERIGRNYFFLRPDHPLGRELGLQYLKYELVFYLKSRRDWKAFFEYVGQGEPFEIWFDWRSIYQIRESCLKSPQSRLVAYLVFLMLCQ